MHNGKLGRIFCDNNGVIYQTKITECATQTGAVSCVLCSEASQVLKFSRQMTRTTLRA